MTDSDLAEIEARCAAATAGPWKVAVGGVFRDHKKHPWDHRADVQTAWTTQPVFKSGPRKGQPKGKPEHEPVVFGIIAPAASLEDAAFIAHARTDVPALLAALRAERQRVGGLEGRVSTYRRWLIWIGQGLKGGIIGHTKMRTPHESDIAELEDLLK